jgi:hypothetical protein
MKWNSSVPPVSPKIAEDFPTHSDDDQKDDEAGQAEQNFEGSKGYCLHYKPKSFYEFHDAPPRKKEP